MDTTSGSAGPSRKKTAKPKMKKNAPKDTSSSKQSSPFPERSVEDKEKLISAVSRHLNLWKKDEANYLNRDDTKNSWDSISAEVDIPANECKILFKNLRDSFAKKLRKSKEGKSGDGLEEVSEGSKARKWVFFEQMRFMEDTLEFRRTESNFEDNNEFPLPDEDTYDFEDAEGQVPTSSNFSRHSQQKSMKRAKTGSFLEKLTQHMEVVGKVLSDPTETPTNDKFLKYLGEILSSVPPEKIRKCEQDILLVANSYVDGKEMQLVEIHTTN